MRRSFEQTGFETFIRLSDEEETPFEAIERIGRRRGPRYVILCHQDVRAEADAAHLTALLTELDTLDPGWVVAGNAGVTPKMRVIRKLSDPHGGSTPERCPQPAITLDENFLVFKRSQRPKLTPGLSGFHFYGTDACLNALARGGGAYVIDFPVTHLSSGNRDPSYRAIRRQFIDAWNGASLFRYAATPSEVLFFSRSRTLRRIFGHPRALSWVGQHRRTADNVWRTIESRGVSPPGSVKSPR